MNNTQALEPLTMRTFVRANNEVIFAELGDEISLLNLTTGVYYTLNVVAASLWRQLHQDTSLGQIKTCLLQEYNVDAERCQCDVMRIVQELHSHGLVDLKPE